MPAVIEMTVLIYTKRNGEAAARITREGLPVGASPHYVRNTGFNAPEHKIHSVVGNAATQCVQEVLDYQIRVKVKEDAKKLIDINAKGAKGDRMTEEIDHPAHYNQSDVEPVDVWDDWGIGTANYVGNAIKYLCRGGHKPGQQLTKDMSKVLWYLGRARQQERTGGCDRWRGAPTSAPPWEDIADAWKLTAHLRLALQFIHGGNLVAAVEMMQQWLLTNEENDDNR